MGVESPSALGADDSGSDDDYDDDGNCDVGDSDDVGVDDYDDSDGDDFAEGAFIEERSAQHVGIVANNDAPSAIRYTQRQSEATNHNQPQTIDNQKQSYAIRSNHRQSEVTRSNHHQATGGVVEIKAT